jgi:hypothetical protein
MFSGIDDINNFSQSRTLHTVVQSGAPIIRTALTSDQINALAPFANCQTSVNNTTSLYALAGATGGSGSGGPTGPAGTTGSQGATGSQGPTGSSAGFTGTYVSAVTASASISLTASGSGAVIVTPYLNNATGLELTQTTPPIGAFGTNVAPASAITVLSPLFTSFPLAYFTTGYYYIYIPLTVQIAQSPVGTPVASAVTPGTTIQHAIVLGDDNTRVTTPLQSVPVVGNATNALYATSIPTLLQGVVFCPSNSVTLCQLIAWTPIVTGGAGDFGSWGYSIPGGGQTNPAAYVQKLA